MINVSYFEADDKHVHTVCRNNRSRASKSLEALSEFGLPGRTAR